MYGLILENMSEYIRQVYGEDRWEEIRRQASVEQPSFSVHQVYPENLIPRLAKKAIQVLGVTEKEFFDQMGVHFVGFVGQYGYDRVLSVLGRHVRDFLNGLDNLHEYLKFSYPRMRAPSFICENETRQVLFAAEKKSRGTGAPGQEGCSNASLGPPIPTSGALLTILTPRHYTITEEFDIEKS